MLDKQVHTFGCRIIAKLPEARVRELNLDPLFKSVEGFLLGAAREKKAWIAFILGACVVCDDITNAIFIEDEFPASERAVRRALIKHGYADPRTYPEDPEPYTRDFLDGGAAARKGPGAPKREMTVDSTNGSGGGSTAASGPLLTRDKRKRLTADQRRDSEEIRSILQGGGATGTAETPADKPSGGARDPHFTAKVNLEAILEEAGSNEPGTNANANNDQQSGTAENDLQYEVERILQQKRALNTNTNKTKISSRLSFGGTTTNRPGMGCAERNERAGSAAGLSEAAD